MTDREPRDKALRDVWARVFEFYYEDANQDFQRSVSGLQTPLLICRELFPLATRALYAHPHLTWWTILNFRLNADRPITACDGLGYADTSSQNAITLAKHAEEASHMPVERMEWLRDEADPPAWERHVLRRFNLFVPAISRELMSDPSPRAWLVRKLSVAPTYPGYWSSAWEGVHLNQHGYTIHTELLAVLQRVEVDELTLVDVYVNNPMTAQLFLAALEAVNTVHEDHLYRSSMRGPNATKQLRFHLELRMWEITADELSKHIDGTEPDLLALSRRLLEGRSEAKDFGLPDSDDSSSMASNVAITSSKPPTVASWTNTASNHSCQQRQGSVQTPSRANVDSDSRRLQESSKRVERISKLRDVPVSELYGDDTTRELLINLGATWVMEDDKMVPKWPPGQDMDEIDEILSDAEFFESPGLATTSTGAPAEGQDTSVKIEPDSDWQCDTERAFFDPGPEDTSTPAIAVTKVDDEPSAEQTVDETKPEQTIEDKIKFLETAASTEAEALWLATFVGAKWFTPPAWIEEGSRVKRERTVLSDWVRSYVADKRGKLDWAHHVWKQAHSAAPTPAYRVAPVRSATTNAPYASSTALNAPRTPPAAIPSSSVESLSTNTVSTASTSDIDWDEARRQSGNLSHVPPPAAPMSTSTWSDLGQSVSSITPTAASTTDNSWSQVGDSLVARSDSGDFAPPGKLADGSANALAKPQNIPCPRGEAAQQAESASGDLKRKHADDVMEHSTKHKTPPRSAVAASNSVVNHIVAEPTYDPIPSGIREHLERGPSTFSVGAMAINGAVNDLASQGRNTLCSNIETYFRVRRETLMRGPTTKHMFAHTTGGDVTYIPRTAKSPWWTPHEVLVSADHVSGWDAGDELPSGIPAPLPFADDPVPPLCWIEDVIPLLPPSITPLPMFDTDTPIAIAAIISHGLASVFTRMSPGHLYLSATDPLAAMAFRLPWNAVPVPSASVRVPAAVRPLDVLAGWGLPVEYGDGHMVRIRPTVLHPDTELFTLECTLEQFNDDSFFAHLPMAVSRIRIDAPAAG